MYVFLISTSKFISIYMSNTIIYILKILNDIAFYVSNGHYSTFIINLILFISFLMTLYRVCDTIGEPVIKARKFTIKDIILRLKGIVKNPLNIFFILACILVIVIIRFNLYSILSVREWGFYAYAYFILSTWLPITYILGVLKSISFFPFNLDFSLKYVKKTITYHNAKKLMIMFVCFSFFRGSAIMVYLCLMNPIDYSSCLIQHITPPAATPPAAIATPPARTWDSILTETRNKRKLEAINAAQESTEIKTRIALTRKVILRNSSILIAQTYPDSAVLIELETYRWGSVTMFDRPAYIKLNSININYTPNDYVYPSFLRFKKRLLDEMYNVMEARMDNISKQANNMVTFGKILDTHLSEGKRANKACGTGSISVNTIGAAGKYFKDCMRLTYKNNAYVELKDVKLNLIPHTKAPTIWDYFYLRCYITKIEALTELSAIGGSRVRASYVPKNWTYSHLRRIKANNDVVFYYVEEQIKGIYLNRETKCSIKEIKREKNWLK